MKKETRRDFPKLGITVIGTTIAAAVIGVNSLCKVVEKVITHNREPKHIQPKPKIRR